LYFTMKIALLIATTFLGGASAFAPPFAPQTFMRQSTALGLSSIAKGKASKPKAMTKEVTKAETIKPGKWLQRKSMEDVMIDPDYYLAWCFAIVGGLITWYHPVNDDGSLSFIGLGGGTFHVLFAILLWFQARRVRLVFEKDAFEFYNIKGPSFDFDKGAYLARKPKNYVSNTINRWKYDTIINWGIYPSLEFPVIIYFKETETPKEMWDKYFAAFDSYGNGQPHFFPGIANARQFKEQMELRGVARKPITTFKNPARKTQE